MSVPRRPKAGQATAYDDLVSAAPVAKDVTNRTVTLVVNRLTPFPGTPSDYPLYLAPSVLMKQRL